MRVVPKAEFLIHWRNSVKLLCPSLRADGAIWLHPFNRDACKLKLCKWWGCHSFGSTWDNQGPYMADRLMVPDSELTHQELLSCYDYRYDSRIGSLRNFMRTFYPKTKRKRISHKTKEMVKP